MVYFFETVKTSFADVPITEKNAVAVEPFIAATEDLIRLFDFLNGTAFAPVKSDMSGNIKKIRERYDKNPSQYPSLQSLVLDEVNLPQKQRVATEGVLWLRRGMEFTSAALRRNLTDKSEELSVSFSKAYEVTLQKHHNMFIRPIFSLAMKACPARVEFYRKVGGEDLVATYALIEPWLAGLEKIVQILNAFYAENKFE